MVDKIITCSITNLPNLDFPINERFGLIVKLNDVEYDFIVNIKTTSDKLLILGPGALPRKYKEIYSNRPYFNRVLWPFNQSTIYYDDPTRRINGVDLLGGWGVGTPNNWHVRGLADIIKIIAKKIYNYANPEDEFKNLIFYGSSMAGFMSIQLSILVKNSISIAEIPQFNVMNWSYWKVLKKQLFADFSMDEIKEKFLYRLNIFDLMIKENYIPNTYLVLDCSVEKDFEMQYKDFLLKLHELPFKDNHNINRIKIRVDGKNIGHEQLGYAESYKLIDDVCLLMDNSLKNQRSLVNSNFFYERSSLKNKAELRKYMTGRIDIKNFGNNNSIEILNSSRDITIMTPKWFNTEEGKGVIFQSNRGCADFEFKCIHDGFLMIVLRGIFHQKDSKAVPIYINFTKLTVNGKDMIQGDTIVWHNAPIKFKQDVADGDIFKIHAEWVPF